MLGISAFKASFQRGIVRPNKFKVIISPPSFIENSLKITENLMIHCYSTDIPSKNIPTIERKTYGPIRKMPYSDVITEDATLNFICTNEMEERGFFEQWVNYIVKSNTYDVAYYDDFVTSVTLFQYDLEGMIIAKYELQEAYPYLIGSTSVDWSDNDSFLSLPVTFAYRNYISKNMKPIENDYFEEYIY